MADPEFPVVDSADSWRLAEESVEPIFEMSAIRVLGATRRYEDECTRTAVREATDGRIDHEWRFVAATRLDVRPSLPPGTLPRVILPAVRKEARRTFSGRLTERGLEDVQQRCSERIRVRSGVRAKLTRFDATDHVEGRAIPVSAWVGVWVDGGEFFVVTGGYPAVELADVFDIEDPPEPLERAPRDCREEFIEFLRAVH